MRQEDEMKKLEIKNKKKTDKKNNAIHTQAKFDESYGMTHTYE